MEKWLRDHYPWCKRRVVYLCWKHNVADISEDVMQDYCLYNFELIKEGKGLRKVDNFFYNYMTRTAKLWPRKDMSKKANRDRSFMVFALPVDDEIIAKKLKTSHEFYSLIKEIAESGIINIGTQTQVYGLYFIQNYKVVEVTEELDMHRVNVRYHINEIGKKARRFIETRKMKKSNKCFDSTKERIDEQNRILL